MLQKKHLLPLLGVATIFWGVGLLVRGDAEVSLAHLVPFSFALSAMGAAVWAYDKWLWKMPRLRWYAQRPEFEGTWRAVLIPIGVDDDGNPGPPIEAYVGVRQTASRLTMDQMTIESDSSLIAHRILPPEKGNCFQVAAVYRNNPDPHLQGVRSEVHLGGFLLNIHGNAGVTSLTGEYWTNRKTKGSMKLLERVPEVYTSFGDAQAAFSVNGPVPLGEIL